MTSYSVLVLRFACIALMLPIASNVIRIFHDEVTSRKMDSSLLELCANGAASDSPRLRALCAEAAADYSVPPAMRVACRILNEAIWSMSMTMEALWNELRTPVTVIALVISVPFAMACMRQLSYWRSTAPEHACMQRIVVMPAFNADSSVDSYQPSRLLLKGSKHL